MALEAVLDQVDGFRADKEALELKVRALTQLVEDETKKRKQCETQAYAARAQQSQMAHERAKLAAQVEELTNDSRMHAGARQVAEGKLKQFESSVSQLFDTAFE